MERYDFDFTKMADAFNDGFLSCVQEIHTQIVKAEDEAVKKAIVRYMKEHAEEYNKRIALFIMDEEEVEKIIDLGVETYAKLNKDDIE